MKIISKFKDYYDYLQGVWGVDEKLILDRTTYHKAKLNTYHLTLPYMELMRFYICGNIVEGVYYQEKNNQVGTFLYEQAIEDTLKEKIWFPGWNYDDRYYYLQWENWSRTSRLKVLKKPIDFYELDHSPKGYYREKKEVQCPTDVLNCPIIVEDVNNYDEFDVSRCAKFPILSDYQFHKVYPAQDLWIMLTEWLGREVIVSNNQTNKEKILSNGFDLKTSFRHPVK